ncbi:MAG: tRNA preQ1(34) S-adenosylmethionine ribosyltransferase-isomerase QueA [Thermoplasmata archaeon]|nr:tRNA preQ1(34) S-adenosylmethionine ribosyltransferase-isomerase QueA [Euryarchaeota archaeon]MVT35498.1 tRNA preQ1(34) S-adenosylmethionine ribosyltransferase-isomerase QueA [Euryarchaeota archaeon]
MDLERYNYYLPKDLIAQRPVEPRDHSRLMVVGNTIEHKLFYEIINYLGRGDVLVFNNSRVIKARLYGKKLTGGKIELLLISPNENSFLVKGKNIKPGTILKVGEYSGEVIEKEEGLARINFDAPIMEIIEKYGQMPLPPYIKEKIENTERYQTVFARVNGSIASPTAGLHFTEDLIKKIEEKGVKIAYVTLHISYATFKEIKNEDIEKGKLHKELYYISNDTADLLNNTEGRIFAVGTTVIRALESSSINGKIIPGYSETDLFIKEPYNFKFKTDGLITNFHIPKSSLIMLVTAYGGYDRIMEAYRIAVENKYRFYSFGDAMLILK